MTVYIRISGKLVELEIVDDGQGFDPKVAGDRGGLGLTTMQERAEKAGGWLSIISTPGEGTQVKARIEIKSQQFSALEEAQ